MVCSRAELNMGKGQKNCLLENSIDILFVYISSVLRACSIAPGCACAHEEDGDSAGDSGGVYNAEQCAALAPAAVAFAFDPTLAGVDNLSEFLACCGFSVSQEGASAWCIESCGPIMRRTDGGEFPDNGDRV